MLDRVPGRKRWIGPDHVLLWAVAVTAVYLAWGAARSRAFAELPPGATDQVFMPTWLGSFLVLVAPAVLNFGWGLTLLPYAIPLADTPQVPHMRFLEELGQLLIVAFGVGFFCLLCLRRISLRRSDLSVGIALWFLAESALSFGGSYFYFPKDAILLKDGITRIMLIALFWLMIWLMDQRLRSWEAWHSLTMASCRAAVVSMVVGSCG